MKFPFQCQDVAAKFAAIDPTQTDLLLALRKMIFAIAAASP